LYYDARIHKHQGKLVMANGQCQVHVSMNSTEISYQNFALKLQP